VVYNLDSGKRNDEEAGRTEWIVSSLRLLYAGYLPANTISRLQSTLLAYRCLHGLAPPYLANELQPVSTLD